MRKKKNREWMLGMGLGWMLVFGGYAKATPRWWPSQKLPKGLVTVSTRDMKPVVEPNGQTVKCINMGAEHMMVQSLAGLAAQGVNEGRFDELVYVNLWDNADYSLWRNMLLRRTGIEDRGHATPWDLVRRYAAAGIVKGYILYSWDASEGEITARRKNSDESCNVASSLAGMLGGIIVSEGQENQAKLLGLECLMDTRGKTEQWLFDNYKEQFSKAYVLLQDPIVPNNRAIAIAHRCMIIYGLEAPTEQVYQWMDKPGLVFGWNDGHSEGAAVSQLSKYGHIIVPSNWALNLPALSLASDLNQIKPLHSFDPRSIDFSDRSPAVSFYMSDGDNLQWMLGSFALNKYYWGSQLNGAYPLGWGVPFADLMQVGVDTYDYLRKTQPENTSMVLMPGYFFPDELGTALDKEQRIALLKQHSARVEQYLQASGTGLFSFLSRHVDSKDAKEAYAIFAREIPSLTGMLAIDYSPYEEGNGEIYWIENAEGIEIPVVTAKYSLWANSRFERSGTPVKVARMINEDAAAARQKNEPFHIWTSVHAWSGFHENWTADEDDENGEYDRDGTQAGVAPTYWCTKRIDSTIKVVSPDELVWRIRMAHRPEQTRKVLEFEK